MSEPDPLWPYPESTWYRCQVAPGLWCRGLDQSEIHGDCATDEHRLRSSAPAVSEPDPRLRSLVPEFASEDAVVVKRVARGRHRCRLPGWWKRRRLNLDHGSVIECTVCGERWALWVNGWESVVDLENLPQPSKGPAPGAKGPADFDG